MGKLLLLGLAVPSLAGCDQLLEDCVDGCIDWAFIPDHGLEVKNAGTRDVRVEVVYDRWMEDGVAEDVETFYLVPGEKRTAWHDDEDLTVTIRRISDGLVLYRDHYSRADFRREHDRIELTVYP